MLAPPSRLTLIIGLWLVSQGISKLSEFSAVGSALVIGFDYPCFACILTISKGLGSAVAVGSDYRGLTGIERDFGKF